MKRNLTLLCLSAFILTANAQDINDNLFDKRYIKTIMIKTANWQLYHPKHEPRDWTNGAFYAGLYAAWETTKADGIYQAMMDMGNSVGWTPYRRWYHADDIVISQMYLDMYRHEKRAEMIQPTLDTLKLYTSRPYPTQGKIDLIKYWWCDALFMAPPTLVKFGVETGDRSLLEINDTYFKECYDLLYNKEEHLFARDLNYVIGPDGTGRLEANGQKIFWSRGNGWVMGGLVRILQELPKNYPARPFYEGLFKEISSRIITLQQEDGLWRASLLDPASYPGGEVSGSGFFCYALAWGINNRLLDEKSYLPAVKKAWIALNRCVNEEGRVGWVQPIGADPRKNFDENSWEVYGTGAFLLAGSEVIKLNR
jgi:unsaturated rhamnogalacturonyl hydrolase